MSIIPPGFLGNTAGLASKAVVPLALGTAGLGAGIIGSRVLGNSGSGEEDKQAAINAALDQHIAETVQQTPGLVVVDNRGSAGGGGGDSMPPEIAAELQARAQLKQARAERKAREDMVMQQMMTRGYA